MKMIKYPQHTCPRAHNSSKKKKINIDGNINQLNTPIYLYISPQT